MDHFDLVFLMIYAVKTNNYELYIDCNGAMASLFFAFNGQNYSKYLTWFEAFLRNIDTSHPGAETLLKKGAISVARSLVPGSLCAVDKTMEETFMRFAKTSGGLSGIFQKYSAYQIHEVCKTFRWPFWYFSEIFSLPKTLSHYVTKSPML